MKSRDLPSSADIAAEWNRLPDAVRVAVIVLARFEGRDDRNPRAITHLADLVHQWPGLPIRVKKSITDLLASAPTVGEFREPLDEDQQGEQWIGALIPRRERMRRRRERKQRFIITESTV